MRANCGTQDRYKAGASPSKDSRAGIERELCYAPADRRGDVPQTPPLATYRVQFHRPTTPAVQDNWEGCAEQWQQGLAGMRRTAALVQAKCGRALARQHADPVAAPEDTVALRRAVNASLTTQMAFFTSCMQAWAGPPRQLP